MDTMVTIRVGRFEELVRAEALLRVLCGKISGNRYIADSDRELAQQIAAAAFGLAQAARTAEEDS